MRILVAEDEKKIARLIGKGLAEQGYSVDLCHDGDEALAMATTEPYDGVILDIMMPGRDGLSVLRQMREKKMSVPVMILTARGEVSERVEGLDLGADDYLAKPFAMDELIARLRALLRRASGEKLSFYKIADLTMNLVSREITRASRKVELTTREFNLLEYLMRTPGQVFTRTQIHERVWEYHFDPGTNLVDVYIQRLRRKIDDGEAVKLIQTVRGVGYCVKLPD
jgi:DNA-binding response OmpR family regulator